MTIHMTGTREEQLAMSGCVRGDGVISHTCSTYARGVDRLWACFCGSNALKGRNQAGGPWGRRHDEYDRP